MFWNEKNGLVDLGKEMEAREDCHNCNGHLTMISTVSMHYCENCGARYSYWNFRFNEKWENHENNREKALRWLDQSGNNTE